MRLSTVQSEFSIMVSLLVAYLQLLSYQTGKQYTVTYGEAWRTPEQSKINAEKGIGVEGSIHEDRLAVDFNLFINGVWQQETDAHLPLGLFWESIGGTWGGRFSKQDGNHYSKAYGGKK